ncbi:methyltransferase domain-containing protein [Nocardia nova SH22a]|uniref:Methyltransferase domain-containing protein n=2 Tax=Nocardia nova TaxID=37330 RepID=W5TTJ1_9NOCA|nr:methyltransferase domain-containing protein [Nocardia nova SH22a]
MVEMSIPVPARHGDYGIDGDFRVVPARVQAVIVGLIIVALLALTVAAAVAGWIVLAVVAGLAAALIALATGSYLWTTRAGKFRVWARILGDLHLRGDERVLDMGCGRGAVLLMAAQLLPRGRAVGIDLWRADQTGNGPEVTRRNAEREGVADRVEVVTGDVTRLPFDDNTFDVVVSSLVLHNIPSAADRRTAIDEAVRVLRPGGRLAVADLLATGQHRDRLRELGLREVRRRNLGPHMWWLGPLAPTRLVSATKPAAPGHSGEDIVADRG